MSVREREKKTREKARPSASGVKLFKSTKREDSKIQRDWSAEERFVNRSFKIRKLVRAWLKANTGQIFETSSLMSEICANYSKCSSVTAYRWLHQYTAPGQLWIISEQEAGLVIQER